MGSFREKLVDLKFAIVFLIIPVLIALLILGFAFSEGLRYIYDKYNYTGLEEMSLFGYLDLAHYRYYAPEEICGWQYFFGNFHFFVIFSLIMAGIFHLIKPRIFDSKDRLIEVKPNQKVKKIGKVSIIVAIGVILLEILFSLLGPEETGLGSHIYINGYYMDIVSLISEGYYTINNKPYFPQMFLTLIPVIAGLGIVFYIHGLKALKERGLVEKRMKFKPLGMIFLIIGLLYFNILLFTKDLTIESGFTSYSAYMTIYWILSAMFLTGIILVIYRKMIPYEAKNEGRYKFKLLPIIFFIIVLAAFIDIVGSVFLSHLGKLDMGDDVEFVGVSFMQISLILIVGFFIIYAIIKEKLREYTLYRVITGLIGFSFLLIVVVYWALNPNAGNIEINWLYNSLFPSIFICSLTVAFYVSGFKIKKIFQKLKERSEVKNDTNESNYERNHERNQENNQVQGVGKHNRGYRRRGDLSKRRRVIAAVLIINTCIIPILVGADLLKERPQILVNNVGMLPNQEKTFFLAMNYEYPDIEGTFEIIDSDTENIVKTGNLERKGHLWGRYLWLGNFTDLKTEGNYYINAKLGSHQKKSYAFKISNNYLDDVKQTSLYWFYYMRCGTAVTVLPPHQDEYVGHEACHLHDAWYLYNDSNEGYVYVNSSHTNMGLNLAGEWVDTDQTDLGMNLTGGWHDSGDYNIYGTRMPPCNYALLYSFNQTPNYFNQEGHLDMYPQNDSIPDIIEESKFGLEFWIRRWYEPEKLFFDSTALGANMSIRWTVFGPPEYEEDYGYGRWISDDEGEVDRDDLPVNHTKLYLSQFLRGSSVHLITASFASMARICEDYGFYLDNVTDFKQWANKSRFAFEKYLGYSHNNSQKADNLYWRGYGYRDLLSEVEMYKLTGNSTYLTNAINISNYIIYRSNSSTTFPNMQDFAFTLQFAKEFNGTLGWNGLNYILDNKTIDIFTEIINKRTKDDNNYFNLLRDYEEGPPTYNNARLLRPVFAAAYAWNLTDNATIRNDLYDFMTRHFDWILGGNIENLCQMEAVPGGENPVMWYTTRYR
ncbi:MAG: hypothetical protein GF364_01550, partial [Candidatus Lokiarchaeota archaeon]|nr:hypothetical protein [Candidatus Lokiarchaeota archaeon]